MMKKILICLLLFTSLSTAFLHAQDIPTGFMKGSIVLRDNKTLSGYLKDNMRSAGTLVLIEPGTGNKVDYTAADLLSAVLDSIHYVSLRGDFFRVLSDGELCYLQKASDGSNKPIYNGGEAIFVKGTDGRINDYFFYDRTQQQLTLLTRKNRAAIIAGAFPGCPAAIVKAGEAGNDLTRLGQAVDIYNHRNQ